MKEMGKKWRKRGSRLKKPEILMEMTIDRKKKKKKTAENGGKGEVLPWIIYALFPFNSNISVSSHLFSPHSPIQISIYFPQLYVLSILRIFLCSTQVHMFFKEFHLVKILLGIL